ncbi:MAG: DNA recombination protein RmuC [Candidatus Uhrbacteria bacterium]|nr:DNA recombination protein RmuC [Candidatus Uhrbacteria bacterium]
MDLLQLLTIGLLGAVVIGIFWLGKRISAAQTPQASGDPQALFMIQNQMNELSKNLGDRMGDTHQAVRQSFAASANIIREVTEKITRMEETSKQVLDVTSQLQQIQDMLKNPKQRGILGEYYLETLLQNVLPPESFKMQYAFKDGEIVDAAVFIRDKIVPIDSKFSLENYNRLIEAENPSERDRLEKVFVNDLKKRIQETSKYIRPEEGTMEFAFMFIPHEAIYYDLLINKIGAVQDDTENILQRAAGSYHVIVVSPTSFLAYLQTVLQGLKALQIEEQATEIRKRVGDLGRHLSAYNTYFSGIGKHLGTTVNQYNSAAKELQKIDKDVLRISGEAPGMEQILIDRPSLDQDA